MDSFLGYYLTVSPYLAYVIAFLGMIFEGEIILFAVAFFVHQGVLDFSMTLAIILAGVFVGDLFWYFLGMVVATRVRWVGRIVRVVCEPFDGVIRRRPFRTIFISKFVYNASHLTIARAGMIGVDFRTFIQSDFPAAVGWVAIVGALGYLSAESVPYVRQIFHYTEIALLAGLIIFFLGWKYATDFLKRWLRE